MTTGAVLVTAAVPAPGPAPRPATDGPTGPLATAELAVERVQVAPAEAVDLARRALAAAPRDPEVAAVAHRALGLAARERYDVAEALRHLRRAVAAADRAGLPVRAAQARTSLSLALAYAGRTQAALVEADRAAPALTGLDAARLEAQRALVLQRLGRREDALAAYRRAVPRLRRLGDDLWEARARSNRGALLVYAGAARAAAADLERAEELATHLRQDLLVAHVRHNRGFLAARQGDVPAALAWYDRADAAYRRTGGQRAMLLLDRCEALLSVGLAAEAREVADEAVGELAAAGAAPDLAEARLALAAAALGAGDPAAAATQARAAAAAFRHQRRPPWALLADDLLLQARVASGERSLSLLRAASRGAAALADAGWPAAAARARLVAGQVALALGQRTAATRELGLAAATRHRGPAQARAAGWHALALLRLEAGDRAGARHALGAGLRVLEGSRSVLGATELRSRAAAPAAALAALGLRLALAGGRPRDVLRWAERWRSGAVRTAPARPPEDAALADVLADLRRVTAELDAARLSGRAVSDLAAAQARLEERVRGLTRQAPGTSGAGPFEACPDRLAAALDGRALVELLCSDGRLWAVVVTGQRVSLTRLAAQDEVHREVMALRAALRRLALRRGSAPSLAAAGAAATHGAARLDALLLAPLRARLGDRPLVVVPTGDLHALPWSLLPSCAGRAVTVAPSAAAWLRAATAPSGPAGPVLLAAGPGLAHADEEVRDLAAAAPCATVLTGAAATAGAVAAGLDGAGLAHLASHGRFRADNPLFSCLVLADGPLTVHDLERLRRPPSVLVLSACDAGLSQVHPGDELLGMTTALLALGTRAVVASVSPVDDATTRALMLSLHAGLRAGLAPADALTAAQSALRSAAGPEAATVAGFTCFGAG